MVVLHGWELGEATAGGWKGAFAQLEHGRDKRGSGCIMEIRGRSR